MRRWPLSRRFTAGVLITLLPFAIAACATPKTADTTTAAAHLRAAPVAGSADYLAYVVGSSRKAYIPGDEKTGTLHVLSRSGTKRSLGAITPTPGFSLVDSTLVEMSFSGGSERVSWWDLSGSSHGRVSIAAPERVVAAAPHGWLTTSQVGGGTLSYRHLDGKTTSLGDPLPAGVGYSVVAGAAGYVAFAGNDENGNGEIVYASWKHPAKRTVLQKPSGTDGNTCSAVGTTWAVCALFDLKGTPLALIHLSDGKQVRTTDRCRFGDAALVGAKAAWVNPGSTGCTAGRVEMLDSHGHITKSGGHGYDWQFQVGALNRLVTTNQAQTEVLGLVTANGTAKVLARP